MSLCPSAYVNRKVDQPGFMRRPNVDLILYPSLSTLKYSFLGNISACARTFVLTILSLCITLSKRAEAWYLSIGNCYGGSPGLKPTSYVSWPFRKSRCLNASTISSHRPFPWKKKWEGDTLRSLYAVFAPGRRMSIDKRWSRHSQHTL